MYKYICHDKNVCTNNKYGHLQNVKQRRFVFAAFRYVNFLLSYNVLEIMREYISFEYYAYMYMYDIISNYYDPLIVVFF